MDIHVAKSLYQLSVNCYALIYNSFLTCVQLQSSSNIGEYTSGGGLRKDLQGRVKIWSIQKAKFEPGRVTAQRVMLLLPTLIDNIYFVICIRLL